MKITPKQLKVQEAAEEFLQGQDDGAQRININAVAKTADVTYRTAWHFLKLHPKYSKYLQPKGLQTRILDDELLPVEERAVELLKKSYRINTVVEMTGLKVWQVNLISANLHNARSGSGQDGD